MLEHKRIKVERNDIGLKVLKDGKLMQFFGYLEDDYAFTNAQKLSNRLILELEKADKTRGKNE